MVMACFVVDYSVLSLETQHLIIEGVAKLLDYDPDMKQAWSTKDFAPQQDNQSILNNRVRYHVYLSYV